MPDARTVLPAPKLLDLIGIRATEDTITLAARTSSQVARCPACGTRSSRVHSHYTRMLADLPWQGIPVTVRLRVRRFFCDQKACNQAIFAEPLPCVAARYGVAGPSGSTAGSRTSLSPSEGKRDLAF
jgi:transposase